MYMFRVDIMYTTPENIENSSLVSYCCFLKHPLILFLLPLFLVLYHAVW